MVIVMNTQKVFVGVGLDPQGNKVFELHSYAVFSQDKGCYVSTIQEWTKEDLLIHWRVVTDYQSFSIEVMTYDEYMAAYFDKGQVKPIDKEDFEYFYECLPPERLLIHGDLFIFRYMERLAEGLARFCIRSAGQHFTVIDDVDITYTTLLGKVKKLVKQPSEAF